MSLLAIDPDMIANDLVLTWLCCVSEVQLSDLDCLALLQFIPPSAPSQNPDFLLRDPEGNQIFTGAITVNSPDRANGSLLTMLQRQPCSVMD